MNGGGSILAGRGTGSRGTSSALSRRLLVTIVAVLAVAVAAATVRAAGGWHVVRRDSDTAKYFTYASVYGDGIAARLTVRATRGNRVKTSGNVRCSNADFSRSVSRDLAERSYIAAGVFTRKPIVRTFAATFSGADSCSFFLNATAGGGTLRAVLEVRP